MPSRMLFVVIAVTGRRIPIFGRIPVTTADFPRLFSELREKDTAVFRECPNSRSSLVSYRLIAPSIRPSNRLLVLTGSFKGLSKREGNGILFKVDYQLL